jgi:hypothetical protein
MHWLFAFLLFGVSTSAFCAPAGEEAPGHAGGKEPEAGEIETELYIGRHGYWHGGLGAVFALSDEWVLGIGAHAQREELGATEVSYYNAEFIRDLGGGLEMEAFGFAYPEVERLQAWGTGLRATKTFDLAEDRQLGLVFGPSYTRARSVVEETFEAGRLAVTLVGSHSFYNRDPEGVETHVGLTDMLHFTAYENNDGFVRNTAAMEMAWEVNDWLTLQASYAAMWFEDETRHATAITPAFKVGSRTELEVGVELLRGGEAENDLFFIGVTVAL